MILIGFEHSKPGMRFPTSVALFRLIHIILMSQLSVGQASDWHLFLKSKVSHPYSKPQDGYCFSKVWKHFHGQLLAADHQCCVRSMDSAYLSCGYPLYDHPCAGLFACLSQTNGHKFVSSLSVSKSLGCESATHMMNEESSVFQRDVLLSQHCGFSPHQMTSSLLHL